MAELAEVIPFPLNDNGDPVVPLDDVEGETEAVLTYEDTDPNLVRAFKASEEGRKALKSLSDTVKTHFEADWEAARGYRERMAEDIRQFSGELPEKDWPFKGAARAHVPITLENISRLGFRIEGEVFADYKNVFGVLPVGPDDDDVADVLSAHGNWQIREKLTDFPRQMSRGILAFLLIGDVTCHSYWDPVKRLNRHEMLTPEEFVTPYVYNTTQPDYSDLPHYTKVFRMYKHELEAMGEFWEGTDKVIAGKKPSFDDEPDEVIREAMSEVYGEEKPDGSEAPYKMLWYEGWLRLPQKTKDRFCKVILDYDTKSVLCLTIHEETNWQDKIRFERQSQEMEAYRAQMIAHMEMQVQLEQQNLMLQQAMAIGSMPDAMLAQQMIEQLSLQVQQAPVPPEWLDEPENLEAQPEEPRKDPLHMFSHGTCIESLVGNLGLSFGRVEADFNRAADTMFSQWIDSNTLANCSQIITTEQVEFPSPFEVGPGKWHKASGVSGKITDHIMPFSHSPGNDGLMTGVDKCYQWGQSAIQAPAVLSGEAGKSGETYRGIAARIEQATKQVSVAAGKFCAFLKQILRNNAKLNSVYLDDEELFAVQNHASGKYDVIRAGRHLYERDYRVEILADLRFAPQAQRIQEADELVQLPAACPPMQGNFAFLHMALSEALKARGKEAFIPMLGPAPGPPETPLGLPQMAFPPGSQFGPPIPPPGMVTGPDGMPVPAMPPPGPGPTPGGQAGAPTPPQGPPPQNQGPPG